MELCKNISSRDFRDTILKSANLDYKNFRSVLKVIYLFSRSCKIYMISLDQINQEILRKYGKIDPSDIKYIIFEAISRSVDKMRKDIEGYAFVTLAFIPKREFLMLEGKDQKEFEKYPTWEILIKKYGSLTRAPKEYVQEILYIEMANRSGDFELYIFKWEKDKFVEVNFNLQNAQFIESISFHYIFKNIVS